MMLCVYSKTGMHVLRTVILDAETLAREKANYEAMGFITLVE